ncbi:hypothetical protein ACFFUB_02315 [Algimonas porphyrae]|uniref:Uncharacterized protein n=1 Tax=Algimonas porphyrae TaxID=1128113 RepID=A0ABQ5UZR9_9PROT|nr:hypothetical protein [Algimonas porphyrae]GLQ20409.1 hypothetical protein GCM10007854_13640 [Algimonas porphyrae]
MTDQTKNPLVTFLATKTGWSTALITGAVAVAGPIISYQLTYQKAFTDGKEAYADAIRAGTAKLDGRMVEIITEAERQAARDAALIAGEAAGYQRAQQQFTTTLETIYAQHADQIAGMSARTFTQEERDWRRIPVPVPTRLRLDAALAAREGGRRGPGLSEVGVGPETETDPADHTDAID